MDDENAGCDDDIPPMPQGRWLVQWCTIALYARKALGQWPEDVQGGGSNASSVCSR